MILPSWLSVNLLLDIKAVEELICRNSAAITKATQPEEFVDISLRNLLFTYRGWKIKYRRIENLMIEIFEVIANVVSYHFFFDRSYKSIIFNSAFIKEVSCNPSINIFPVVLSDECFICLKVSSQSFQGIRIKIIREVFGNQFKSIGIILSIS